MTACNAEVTCMQISVVWADSRSVSFVCGVQSALLFHSSSTVSLPFTYLHFLSNKTAHLTVGMSVCGAFQTACNSILSLWILQMYKFYSYPPIIFLYRCDHNRVLETNIKQRTICMVKTAVPNQVNILASSQHVTNEEVLKEMTHTDINQSCRGVWIGVFRFLTAQPGSGIQPLKWPGKYTLPVWPLQGKPLIPVCMVYLS